MTKTEQIAAAITSILQGAGLSVRQSTDKLYSYEDLPAIVVVLGGETPRPVTAIGPVYWDLSVSLLIGAEGDSPTLAPEPTRAAAHAALCADRTLGGIVIDLSIASVNRQIDADNPALGITDATYNILYRQTEGLL